MRIIKAFTAKVAKSAKKIFRAFSPQSSQSAQSRLEGTRLYPRENIFLRKKTDKPALSEREFLEHLDRDSIE